MIIPQFISDKRQEIVSLANKHGVTRLSLFGSFAKGLATQDSDIDFLIQLEPNRSLFDHIAFKQDLEELLQRKTDVVTEKSLHWYIRDQVLQEAIPI